MSYRRGYYRKDGTYVQGHFVSSKSKRKTVKSNKNKGCTTAILISLFFVFLISCVEEGEECESKKCSDFSTLSKAQRTFDLILPVIGI